MFVRKTLVITLAAALTAASLAAQSVPTYWRLADPQAKILIGVNWKSLRESPMAADWKTQLEKATGGLSLNAVDQDGLLANMLSHMDRVFITASDIPQGAKSKPQGTVAITGDFDLAELRKFMAGQGGVKSLIRGVEVWQSSKVDDNVTIALVSSKILAFGDKASIRRAVTQYALGDGSQAFNGLYQRAAELYQTNDIWIAGEIPASATSGKGGAAAASPVPLAMLNSLKSFDLGVRLRTGLDLQVDLFAATPEDAASLGGALQAMAQLAASGQTDPQVAAMLARLQMGTDGNRVHFAATWTQTELAEMTKKGIATARSAATSASLGGTAASRPTARGSNGLAAAAAPADPAPAGPPKPLKVRIYNPDSGVKEFELKRE